VNQRPLAGGVPAIPDALEGRAYWVQPGRLMAGAIPGSPDLQHAEAKIRALASVGIRHIVNLMEPDERDRHGDLFWDYTDLCATMDITVARYPIRDVTAPSVDVVRAVLTDIDASIAAARPVYVHCWGGRGRTGVIVGCWLIEHGLASPADAIDRIAGLRSGTADGRMISPQTPDQEARVRGWSRAITSPGAPPYSYGSRDVQPGYESQGHSTHREPWGRDPWTDDD
jgi:protein tyrosine phosphatase (PTP) superfamily phosphohydrolase (DUF442 family)